MKLTIIDVPYDSGRFGERMGAGPLHLLESGLVESLAADGHDVRTHSVRLPGFLIVGAATQAAPLRSIGIASYAPEADRDDVGPALFLESLRGLLSLAEG